MFDNLSDKLDRAFKTLKGQGKITEIIVLDTNREVYAQAQIPKKSGKKTGSNKKNNKADDIEVQHFLRLGEELNKAN